jgi:hypothetical protein
LATSNKNFKVKNGLDVAGAATADSFVKLGGTSEEFLMADGSVSEGGGGGSLEVSETPPTSPSEGDIWYNSTSGQTFVYYDSYWVENVAGVAGPQGPEGPQGPIGETGPQGPEGGPPGPEGPAGADGADGADALWNFTGAWENGIDYNTGDVVEFNGSSYYAPVGIFSSYSPPENGWVLVASKGDTGSDGADGATGPEGPQGPQGLNGLDGLNGADGADGDEGPQGPEGPQGLQGPEGPEGPEGPAGENGLDGLDGADGETGVVISESAPLSTEVLWLDSDAVAEVPVPTGGTTGQVLAKSSNDDYDTEWKAFTIPDPTPQIFLLMGA